MKKYITKNAGQTQKLGEGLAKKITQSALKKSAVVLCLQGELGTGKTTFLQGFAKGLGVKEIINSPTFVIMKKFKITENHILQSQRSSGLHYKWFFHFDLYRLNFTDEILYLGFKEIISNPENIVAIEWPEKIKSFIPKNAIIIKFFHVNKSIRNLIFLKIR